MYLFSESADVRKGPYYTVSSESKKKDDVFALEWIE
jgi:hypothetical protein